VVFYGEIGGKSVRGVGTYGVLVAVRSSAAAAGGDHPRSGETISVSPSHSRDGTACEGLNTYRERRGKMRIFILGWLSNGNKEGEPLPVPLSIWVLRERG